MGEYELMQNGMETLKEIKEGVEYHSNTIEDLLDLISK